MVFPVLIFPFWHLAKGERKKKKSKQNQLFFLISTIVFYLFYSLVLRRGNFNIFFSLFLNKIDVYNSMLYGKHGEAKNKIEGREKVVSSQSCKWNDMKYNVFHFV